MSKHTQGEWEQAGARVGREGYGVIAETFGNQFDANARLISRAPTMLSLLEEALLALATYQTHPESCYDADEPDGGQPNGDCLRCRIRREIEAARGCDFQAFRKAA